MPFSSQTQNYVRSGRGGAGNFRPVNVPSPKPQPRPPTPPPRPHSRGGENNNNNNDSSKTLRFFTGIGGAGNAHCASNPSAFLSAQEHAAYANMAARQSPQPLEGHYGVGGAGNVYRNEKTTVREGSINSVGSTTGILSGLKNSFSR